VLDTLQINAYTPPPIQQFELYVAGSRTGTATLGVNAFNAYQLYFTDPLKIIYGPPPLPLLTIAPASVAEGNSGTAPLNFVATLSNTSASAVTFNVTTTAQTATAASDYQGLSNQLITIPANALSVNVPVTINGDAVFEADETFSLAASTVTGAILSGASSVVGTIQNDDLAPVISVDALSVIEGNSGFSNALISVRRVGLSALPSTVNFTTEAGTAATPADFETASGALSFAPNEQLKFLLVRVVGDTVAEADESFRLRLSTPVGATVSGGGFGTITIVNDDAESVAVSGCGARVEEASGNAVVSLVRTGSNPISVTFSTIGISASPGQDYTPVSGNVSWAAGELAPKTVNIPIIDDPLIEGFEEFAINLDKVSPGGALGAPSTQLIRIGDNDERLFSDDLETPRCLP
jgi:hypothetical protein